MRLVFRMFTAKIEASPVPFLLMAPLTQPYKIFVNGYLIATAHTECMAEWIANDLELRAVGDLLISIEKPPPAVLQVCY